MNNGHTHVLLIEDNDELVIRATLPSSWPGTALPSLGKKPGYEGSGARIRARG